jgi:hypothetical protein
MISKWIRVENDGTISLISEVENLSLIKIEFDITQEEYESIFFKDLTDNKYIYVNGALELNPNYVIPYNFDSEVQKQIEKRQFGQYTIAEFMVETKVEGLFNTNPQLAQQTIVATQGLVNSLASGWLLLAITQIKIVPQSSLNDILTSDILLKYRNKLHEYLGFPEVLQYNA